MTAAPQPPRPDPVAAVADLPALLRDHTMAIEARLRRLIATPDIYRLRQIILIGSGDSLIAGIGAASSLRAWTGLAVQAMPAMEAARYVDAAAPMYPPRGVLALCLSSSGEGARVIEAARRLRAWGALTVALTANPDSRLARSAERVGALQVPAVPGAAARGYACMLMAVWLLGMRLAEVRMRMTMDQANALRATLVGMGDALEQAIPSAAAVCATMAAQWHGFGQADALGSGPGLGSAHFAAAKLIETAGIHASAQDIEEFHHLNYFVARPAAVPALVFTTAAAPAASRTDELVAALGQLGRPMLVVTDRPGGDAAGTVRLPVVPDWAQPLLHAIPAVMLADAWAARSGAVPFRGHDGPWRGARDAGLVRDSAILPRPEIESAAR